GQPERRHGRRLPRRARRRARPRAPERAGPPAQADARDARDAPRLRRGRPLLAADLSAPRLERPATPSRAAPLVAPRRRPAGARRAWAAAPRPPAPAAWRA